MKKNTNLKKIILDTLDSNKALDIISIDLKNKSSMADYMIIASGTSSRHIQALSEQVLEKLRANGVKNSKIEGKESLDWKLVDGIDLIVHIFNPDKRKFYEDKIASNRTIDLIKHLNKDKKFEIYFIMGADNLINFHKWYKWKAIIKKCSILVFDRQGYKAKSLKSVTFNSIDNKNLTFVNFNKVNISSSQLRKV